MKIGRLIDFLKEIRREHGEDIHVGFSNDERDFYYMAHRRPKLIRYNDGTPIAVDGPPNVVVLNEHGK